MKQFYLTAIICLVSVLAQNITVAQSPCLLNGTNGSAISTNPVPYTPGLSFKTNTFDWKGPQLTVKNPGYNIYNPITNFFNRPNLPYSQHIAKGSASDYQWTDGWELVKRDFGYLADQTNNPVSAPGPYMVLYNKYNGILRVIAALPGLGANQVIDVRISFKSPDPTNPNLANLKVSGLFNTYDTIARSMDMQSTITNVTTPAVFPGFDFEFFYADFQTNYDPCTCVFETALVVDFATVNKLDVMLQGNLLGVNDPIANYQNGTAALDQNHDYLASVYRDKSGGATSGMLMYKYINSLAADYQKAIAKLNPSNDPAILDELNSFASQWSSGVNVLALVIPGSAEAKAAFGVFESIAKITGFFSGIFKDKTTVKVPPMPSVIHAQMALKGQITDQRAMPGATFNFANPGCLNSNSKPEYNDGVPPRPVPPSVDYPIYNEVLGPFALLKTPKIVYTSNPYNLAQTCSYGGPMATTDYYPYRVLFKLAENLQYAFNPALNVDESKTEIKAAFLIKPYSNVTDNCAICTPCDGFRPINMDRIEKSYVNGSPSPNYVSPFLPLNYFSEFKAGMINWEVHACGDGGCNDYYTPGLINDTRDAFFLKLIIKLVSRNTDANGNPIVQMLEYTYPIPQSNISSVTGDFGSSNFVWAQENVTLGTIFFDYNEDIYAYKNIYITGNLVAKKNWKITIRCAGQIIQSPGVTLTGNIILQPNTPLINPGPSYGAQSQSAVTSFCNSSAYQANIAPPATFSIDQPGETMKANPTPLSTTASAFSVSDPFPNPSSHQFAFTINNDKSQHIDITLNDMSGKVIQKVAGKTFEKGTQVIQESLPDLPGGAYLLFIKTSERVIVKKLSVVK